MGARSLVGSAAAVVVAPVLGCAFVAITLVLVACEKRRPTPNPTPCVAALLGVFNALRSGNDPFRGPGQRRTLACPELYRHASCGDAWTRVLALGDARAKATEIGPAENFPDATEILRACKEAYCTELPSKPAACSRSSPNDNAALVAALTELDTAILSYELGDANLAKGLATRANFFRVYTSSFELPPLPSVASDDEPPTVTLEITADESLTLNGQAVTQASLEKDVRKLGDASTMRAVVRADKRASHGSVISALDALKRAGVRKIAFAVEPAGTGTAH